MGTAVTGTRADQPASRRGTWRIAVLLAWVAGGVDVTGYLALAHLFTAHMSGNSVALVASLGTGEQSEVWRRGAAIALFALGIAVATAVAETRRERGRRHPTVAVFGLECVLLLAFVVLGTREPLPSSDEPRFYLLVALPTVAMGLQSATLRRIGRLHVRTTYISGILTTFVEELVRSIVRRGQADPEAVGAWVYGSVLVGFLLGAGMCAIAYAHTGAVALMLPISGLLGAIAFDLLHPHELARESDG